MQGQSGLAVWGTPETMAIKNGARFDVFSLGKFFFRIFFSKVLGNRKFLGRLSEEIIMFQLVW